MSEDATVKLRPRDISTLLAHCIKLRKPILLVGAPGVGKSALVEQAASAVGAKTIISHPVVADPTDAKGLPWPDMDKRTAHFLPFGELAEALAATEPTVWFLDDLGQASPAVQASFMQLLLARRINGHALPGCVTFIAATNRRTDRAGVSGILEPVKSRFATIVELEVNVEDWCDWYLDTNGSPEVLAFIRNIRPSLLHDFHPTADLSNSPCPRGWASVGSFINAGLSKDIELAAVSGCVGKGAASEFIGYLRVWREFPPLDAIIADPMAESYKRDGVRIAAIPPPNNPSARYALVAGLATKATVQTLPNILKYTERLLKEAEAGEFAALLLRDMHRRDQTLVATNDWLKMTFRPLGRLISGTDFTEPSESKAVTSRKARR